MRLRTGYSFGRAVGTIDEYLDHLKQIDQQIAPITDHKSAFGWGRWAAGCDVRDLIPVFGVELPVYHDAAQIELNRGAKVDDWVFLAKSNLTGIEPLSTLIEKATGDGLTRDEAIEMAGDVFIMCGHRTDPRDIGFHDHLFFELSPRTSMGQYRTAKERGHLFVASNVNSYCKEADRALLAACMRRPPLQSYPQDYLCDDDLSQVLNNRFDHETIENAFMFRTVILNKAAANRARLKRAKLPKLAYEQCAGVKPHDSLVDRCVRGLEKLRFSFTDYADEWGPEYEVRLKRELEAIEAKGFSSYFEIVADVVGWARERMQVGPARGSAAGSLVCFLTGITTVNPIKFGLLFERFIDINRSDLPDIDIDFPDSRRDEVFSYLCDMYGADHVAKLGTVATFGQKAAIQQLKASCYLDQHETELPETAWADHRALRYVNRMIGHPRHAGTHAAGVVVSDQPIASIVPIDGTSGAVHCDKEDAEHVFGLLKIDCLGLSQLSVFSDIIEDLGFSQDHFDTLPLDDPAVFDTLNSGRLFGIFQFNGEAMRRLCQLVTIKSFDDMATLSALARPGPLQSGAAMQWVSARNGVNLPPQPLVVQGIVSETNGVIVYQEQIMKICKDVGNMSWQDVSAVRRIIGKSKGAAELQRFQEKFMAGADRHVSEIEAANLWAHIESAGGYAFNKSHSVAYAMISYWCAWAKTFHPLHFAAATLTHERATLTETKAQRQMKMLREIEAEGIKYQPFDAELSDTIRWKVSGSRIIGPYTILQGVGEAKAETMKAAHTMSLGLDEGLRKDLQKTELGLGDLWAIRKGIETCMPDPLAINVVSPITEIDAIQQQADDIVVCTVGLIESIRQSDDNHPEAVKRRGGRVIDGNSLTVSFVLASDTANIRCKIPRWADAELREDMLATEPGETLVVVKGKVWGSRKVGITMISAEKVRIIGTLRDTNVQTAVDKPISN